MNKLHLTILICVIFEFSDLYSQKAENPPKITINDFSVSANKSTCLWYRSVFSFPYSYSDGNSGASDDLFKLKNDIYIRILLNKNDTCLNFFAVHRFYESVPEINSLTFFYLNDKKIISTTIKTGAIAINNFFEKGYYVDLSTIKDPEKNLIVDLKLSVNIKSKHKINFYIDKNLDYKYLTIRMDIPEIYKYKINYDSIVLTEKISKPHSGPIIGYDTQYSGIKIVGAHLVSKKFVDLANSPITTPTGSVYKPNRMFPPFKIMLTTYTFNSKNYVFSSVDEIDKDFSSIVTFQLKEIKEIH
jgi:hypothetical protein